MIHTKSIAYVDRDRKLSVVLNADYVPLIFFITAPDIDRVRVELRANTVGPTPVLFITRQTDGPVFKPASIDFEI